MPGGQATVQTAPTFAAKAVLEAASTPVSENPSFASGDGQHPVFVSSGKGRHRLVHAAAVAGAVLLAVWAMALAAGSIGFGPFPELIGRANEQAGPSAAAGASRDAEAAPSHQPASAAGVVGDDRGSAVGAESSRSTVPGAASQPPTTAGPGSAGQAETGESAPTPATGEETPPSAPVEDEPPFAGDRAPDFTPPVGGGQRATPAPARDADSLPNALRRVIVLLAAEAP